MTVQRVVGVLLSTIGGIICGANISAWHHSDVMLVVGFAAIGIGYFWAVL